MHAWYPEPRTIVPRQYNDLNKLNKGTKKKGKWKRFVNRFQRELEYYCENTTLHGFRYISSGEVTTSGKLTWLTICLLSFGLSIYLMLGILNKYTVTPTVTSVESTTYPIWGLRFPAVTICNFNKVYKTRVDRLVKFMEEYGLNKTEIENFFTSLPKLIHEEYLFVDITPGWQYIEHIGYTPETLMYHLMQPCDKLISECTWLGTKYDCAKVFKTVKTFDGFCCAFNYHVIGGEYPSGGFGSNNTNAWNMSTQPGVHQIEMVPGAGRETGLYVVVNIESDSYGVSTRPYTGAAILIHDPLIYPEIDIQTVIVQPSQEVSVIVKGNVIESEDNIRSLNLKQRKCLFQDEHKLNTSTEYSYQSCITECRMQHIIDRCKCLPFYYPKTVDKIKRCRLKDVQCLRSNKADLSAIQTRYNDDKSNETDKSLDELQCRSCLPSCSVKWYSLETENAYLTSSDYSNNYISSTRTENYSAITVFFPDITCLKYRRETFMTWDNLLASFGGIFGLCIGGSFVSFVEIFYYILVRIVGCKKTPKSKKATVDHVENPVENLEIQPISRLNELPTTNWSNRDYERGPYFNNDDSIVPRGVPHFPRQDLNRTTFTIELSNPQSIIKPSQPFLRM